MSTDYNIPSKHMLAIMVEVNRQVAELLGDNAIAINEAYAEACKEFDNSEAKAFRFGISIPVSIEPVSASGPWNVKTKLSWSVRATRETENEVGGATPDMLQEKQ